MKRQNKNIILLGPKAVGKTLISNALKTKLSELGFDDYEILNLDEFFNFCKDSLENNLFLSSTENKNLLNKELSKIDTTRADYEEIVNFHKLDFYEWIEKKYRWNEIFSFPDFNDILLSYEQIMSIQQLSKHFDTNTIIYFNQLIYLLVLKKCLEKTDIPLIIDAGANIGCDINFTPEFRSNLENLFSSFNKDGNLDNFQNDVLSLIGTKVCLLPGQDYSITSCIDINDEINQIYLENLESYKRNSDISVIAQNLFTDNTGDEFKTRKPDDATEKFDRQKLLNKEKVNALCNAIIKSMIEQNKIKIDLPSFQ